MDDATSQLYSRLTVHEFALELMMANWVVSMPERDAERFFAEFAQRMRRPWAAGSPAAEPNEVAKLISDSVQLADHFVEKVRRRSSELRSAASRPA
jgi:hypothetical protein